MLSAKWNQYQVSEVALSSGRAAVDAAVHRPKEALRDEGQALVDAYVGLCQAHFKA